MVRRYSLLALAGLAAAGAAIAPSYLAAQSNTARLSAIASQTTVQIIGQNSGSGVLIGKRGDTYCLLTAKHVVPSPDEYDIVTSDGDMHPLEFDKVVHIRDVDLAIAQFTSPKPYEVIELGDSDQIGVGDPVFVSGWPQGRRIQGLLQFTSGNISSLSPRSLAGGYRLIYTNATHTGMSGGPILSQQADVIGIHGQVEGREIYIPELASSISDDTPFRLGIPINTYLTAAEARLGCSRAAEPPGSADAGSPGPAATAPEETGPITPAPPPVASDQAAPEVAAAPRPAPQFTGTLRLVSTSNPSQRTNRQGNYYFTIDLAANAGQPLQQVTFKQVEGLEFPKFDVDDTRAFAGDRRSPGVDLPLGLVLTDPLSRSVTVTFDPPLPPGQEFTVALNARNPGRDGAYLYQVVVYPEGDDRARGRVIGTGRLMFRRPQSPS